MCPPKRVTGNNLVLHKALHIYIVFALYKQVNVENYKQFQRSQPGKCKPIRDCLCFGFVWCWAWVHETPDVISLCYFTCGIIIVTAVVLVTRDKHYTQGEKAFSSAAPRLWNNLPLAMPTTDSLSFFKKQLKT